MEVVTLAAEQRQRDHDADGKRWLRWTQDDVHETLMPMKPSARLMNGGSRSTERARGQSLAFVKWPCSISVAAVSPSQRSVAVAVALDPSFFLLL